MPAQLTTIETQTGGLYFQLLDSGIPIDLTDFTVELLLTGVDTVALTVLGTVTVEAPELGVISYTPDDTDLTAVLSPFKARWKLTDDSGSIFYVPSAYRDEWDVVPV